MNSSRKLTLTRAAPETTLDLSAPRHPTQVAGLFAGPVVRALRSSTDPPYREPWEARFLLCYLT